MGSVVENNFFVEGAVSDVYSWRPKPWWIPNDCEISKLESLLCQPGQADDGGRITDDGIRYFHDMTAHLRARNTRWHFSAAAVAIDFCKYSVPTSPIMSRIMHTGLNRPFLITNS